MDVELKRDLRLLLRAARADLVFPEVHAGHTFEFHGKGGLHVGNWFMASTPRHPFWLHVLRTIEDRAASPLGHVHEQPQPNWMPGDLRKNFHIIVTTGPYLLGRALATWRAPAVLSRLRMVCDVETSGPNGFFVSQHSHVWTDRRDLIEPR
mmetsp:Transcript_64966/g.211725  ORF Transcript_64966/g.211725 Transcript_64966/m.211725 type:complete len:151 (+) Transcript_64966:998-1450(+)